MKWWNGATYFKKPLYQCLLYRELLQTHLEVSDLRARIGIMLVPYNQAHQGKVVPGLCTDFQNMEKEGLLETIKSFQWFPWESECVRTVILPWKLFSRERLARYLEDGVLKETTVVKDIVDISATVKDMWEELGLLRLKMEDSLAKDESVVLKRSRGRRKDSESEALQSKKRVLAILGGEFLRAKEANPVLAETLAIDNSASDAASYIFIFTVARSAALVCVQSVLCWVSC